MLQPTQPGYEVHAVWAAVRELQRQVDELSGARAVYWQRATVTTYVGGSTTCVVTFSSGGTASLPFLSGYTPVVAHVVAVVTGPEGSFVAWRLSV